MLRIKYYQTNVKCALPFTDTFWYVPCSPSRSVCFVMRVCVFVCAYRCVVNLVHFQFQDSPRFIWIRFSLVEVGNCWFFLASIAWWIEWIRYVQKWDRIFFFEQMCGNTVLYLWNWCACIRRGSRSQY